MVIFQKLERALEKIFLVKNKFKIYLLFFFATFTFAQADRRFQVFDWHIIGNNSSINSISEGFKYYYFATSGNGILRYNKFSSVFDKNLSRGQGIISKEIKHVHFDNFTGILWLVGDTAIEYSNDREGNWFSISYEKLMIDSFEKIYDIGCSKNYIWIKYSSRYLKLNHLNGSLLGIYTYPDEEDIYWGDISFENDSYIGLPNLDDYFVEDNWFISPNGATDNFGNFLYFNTAYLSKDNKPDWIGLSNGFLLKLDKFSNTIKPIFKGLISSPPYVYAIDEDKIWLAGQVKKNNSGLINIDISFKNQETYRFLNYPSIGLNNIYSMKMLNREILLGSYNALLVFDLEKKSFKKMNFENINLKSGKLLSIENVKSKIFLGSREGISIIDLFSKRPLNYNVFKLFNQSNSFLRNIQIYNDQPLFLIDGKILKINEDLSAFSKFDKIKKTNFPVYFFKSLNNKLFIADEEGIYNNFNNIFINSTVYFNLRVKDIHFFDNKLYIGTNNGLIVFDYSFEKEHSYYEFEFLKNIFRIDQIGNSLIFLTEDGLVTLRI